MNMALNSEVEVAGDRYTLLELPTKENGGRIKFDVWMGPTPDDLIMPLHSHPEMTEINEMLEGQMEIFTGSRQILVSAGESYSSDPGVPHRGRNPGTKHSHFHWSLVPEDSIRPRFETVVGNYMAGCAACGALGHFAILRLEQYLHEGLTGKDYATGEPVSAEESLKEVGSFIDRAGGLKVICESAKVLLEGKAYVSGIAPAPVSNKLFELLAVILDQGKSA